MKYKQQQREHLKSQPRKNKVTFFVLKGWTYQEIAEELGITRQRVQQLNKPDRATIKQLKERANGRCEYCGMKLVNGHAHHISENVIFEDYQKLSNLKYLCTSCHSKSETKVLQSMCKQCGKIIGYVSGKKYCSTQCRHDFLNMVLICPACGNLIEKSKARYEFERKRQRNFFCSHRCQALSRNEDYKPLN
jgi:YHS domain-containing protein